MTEEDTIDTEKMENILDRFSRDRVGDLANTAHLLGSWMSEKNYTIAEQLSILELLRSSLIINYAQMQQMEGMAKFVEEHPNTKVVVVDGDKRPAPDRSKPSNPNNN